MRIMSYRDILQPLSVDDGRWRIVAAAAFAIVGTAVLLMAFDRIPLVVINWEPIVTGHIVPDVSYDRFNAIWLAVRAIMGLYISFVFLIIGGQLLGHWRRYVVEGGEP